MTEDFEFLPKALTAEQRRRMTFLAAVGQSISMWSGLESILVVVASVLLGVSQEKAGLVLYSIQNFHLWLNIIDDLFAAETRYVACRSEWTNISDRLRSLNDTRVRLAHHTVFHGRQDPANPSLKPGKFDIRTKSQKYKPLDAGEIIKFAAGLQSVSNALMALVSSMNEQGYQAASSPYTGDAQADDPPPEGAQ